MLVSPDGQSFCQNKNHVAPAVDSSREEFRKYLESSGMLDVLTRVIKDMYEKETKPTDPLNCFIQVLGAVNFDVRESSALKDEIRELKALVKNLEEENKFLREKLEKIDLEEQRQHFIFIMVRVKYRYVLAELVTETHTTALKIPLGENDLKLTILHSVQDLYGDYGLACITAGFSIKMFNPVTRIVILRVRRKYQSVLKTTLPLITAAGQLKLTIRTLHLSGTIRSSLKSLIRFDREKLTKLINIKQLSGSSSEELSEMIRKCQGRLTKRRLDK